MPVENHPVHELTRVGADHKYGCNTSHPNYRPPQPGYWAPDRIYDRRYLGSDYEERHVWIEDKASEPCIFPGDSACIECKRLQKT